METTGPKISCVKQLSAQKNDHDQEENLSYHLLLTGNWSGLVKSQLRKTKTAGL